MIKQVSKPNIDQKLLTLLVTSVKDYAIFMIDPQGYIISWNNGAERIKGYRESEILGKHISVFYTKTDIDKNEPQHNLNEALKSGSYENEGWRVRKDGSIFWANAIFTPLFDEDQKLLGFAKVTRDVTERKKTEDKRQEQYIELERQVKANTEKILAAEIHYRKLIENSHDGIALFDKDLNVFYRSPSAQRITGWGKKERDGLGIGDIIHPDDKTLVSGLFLKILDKPEAPVICSYRVRHKLGHYIWLECVFNNKLDDPDMRAIVCNFRDVTAKKESELLLQKTVNELSAYKVALDESAIVAITDQTGIIKHVNDNFCGISKYSREELLGQDHRIINSSYHEKALIAGLWHTIANGKIWKGELRNKAKDGSFYWVDTTIVPFLNERGKPYQYVAIRSDITERKKAESEIQRTVKELSAYQYALDESAIVAITDQKGIIKHVNDNFCRISKFSREELLGQDHRIINSSYHEKAFIAGLWRTIANGKIWKGELKNKAKDGSYYWVDTTIVPFLNEQGKPYQYLAIRSDITERKEAESEIQRTVKELSAYQYALDESAIIAITDQKGIIKHVNDNFCRISKYSREELLGQDHRIINSAYHDKSFIAGLWRTIANGKIWKGELKNKAKDGTNYWVDTTIVPFLNEQGKPYQYLAIRSDITERKSLEELLGKTTELARIGGWEIDLVNGTYYWSDITKEIHEVEPHYEPTPEKSVSFYPDERYRTALTNLMHDALNNGKPGDAELQIVTPKGNHKWIRVIVESEFVDGKCSRIYGSCQDIDARKKAEISGKRALEERNQILESIDDAFFAVDKNWIVTYWNKMAEKVLLTPKDKILGHNLWEIFSDSVGSESYKNYHIALETNQAAHFEDYHPPLDKWYEISAYPSDTGLSVYFKDVTDRKNSETRLKELNEDLQNHAKELAASNEELEQFAYVASHDLQEPLRMVTGFLTQLEKKYQDVIDEKGKQYIYFAVDGAKRMRQIILDLLEYSRAGKTVSGLERINLNKLMDEMRVLYRKQLDSGAQIINDELPVIVSYKTSLWQVLQNLIGNALKYHKKDVAPAITLTCSETNTHWQFCVEDNGIGIESEYFTKIFIIFQRLHRKGEYSGTGIGLAIAKKLVENLGGKIWVDSVKGQGTRFYFTILKNETL
ncbi:PAS domain S-box protein [Mucilaginibacter sp. BT774]|uniref:PAS domain S-box protein n=1 Tax=Mucilaginibacter sp. BT774 TaxID=3062276 RepID=UPI002676BC01|nr:PAS domain S-box protein [Mucilaginibacter sp. BT774]MDO3625795.1 PAS domain S-box protein [Mucilaginibacter sp. BT774]